MTTQLMHGDCLEVLKTMPDNSVDSIVTDPFMGSGSTGKAATLEGFDFIGIEREADYLAIAQQRIESAKNKPEFMQNQPLSHTECAKPAIKNIAQPELI